jgi:hypothetical protein
LHRGVFVAAHVRRRFDLVGPEGFDPQPRDYEFGPNTVSL